jgi:hypothetical protein
MPTIMMMMMMMMIMMMMMLMLMIKIMMKSTIHAIGYPRCIKGKRFGNDKVQGANSTFSLNENISSALGLFA